MACGTANGATHYCKQSAMTNTGLTKVLIPLYQYLSVDGST